jgi:hypothetical protein
MKFFLTALILSTLLLSSVGAVYAQKDKVLVAGSPSKLSGLIKKLSADFDITFLNNAQDIKASSGKVLILAAEETVNTAYRFPVHNFLKNGGHVVFIGKESFNYEPEFYNGTPVTDFKNDFAVVYPERKFKIASVDKPEISFQTVNASRIIELKTINRGMRDVLLGVKMKNKATKTKNVISFKAKGSHFMDLLALEIKDVNGRKWYSFVPVSTELKTYSISIANFIPESWSDLTQPYPLLNPELVDSLYLGVNTATVWKEKAMSFAIGDLKIGENRKNTYLPSAILKTLRQPFQEIGIQYPDWIIDPFFNCKVLNNVNLTQGTKFLSPVSISGSFPKAYTVAEYFYEHPVSTSGTDTKKSYDQKENRVSRLENLLTDRQSGLQAGQFIQFANGSYKLGSISSIGIDVTELQSRPAIINLVADLVKQVAGKPRIINVVVNTTEKKDAHSIFPIFKINIQNPTHNIVKGKVELLVNNQVMNTMNIAMVPNVNKQYNLELKAFPAGFALKKFQWQVKFTTATSVDILNDTVDVEKALLVSFKYLADAQKLYPDGRFSNHYFGDAYGVRAMFAYLNYLRKNPQSNSKTPILKKDISAEEVKTSAENFYDMLAKRQLPFGAYPMGYSEHAGGYNVADGGQMAVSMMQSLGYITDAARRDAYVNSVVKFGNWAEEFYITPELSTQLKISHPEEDKKGQTIAGLYGLGLAGKKKFLTGPSWVLSDIIAAQILLSKLAPMKADKDRFKIIAERNSRFYVKGNYNAAGYYQAEALFWIFLSTKDEDLKNQIRNNLKETFINPLLKGVENDMYQLGGRATLKALPLLYYQRYIEDNEDVRAILFKYIWNFASAQHSNSIYYSSTRFPKAVHGESLAASKYAALSSLWAMELIDPGSSLIPLTD